VSSEGQGSRWGRGGSVGNDESNHTTGRGEKGEITGGKKNTKKSERRKEKIIPTIQDPEVTRLELRKNN